MLLYVAAGQVFTSLDKAVDAAGGNSNSVKSFSDFFSAEEYASGGACDQASSTAACIALSQTSPTIAPANSYSLEPSFKRQRYDAPMYTGPARYADAKEKIRAALATWTPHPDFSGSLKLSRPPEKAAAVGGHVHDADQERAVKAALDGQSFLLTGSAGTGKSYVLRKIIKELRTVGKHVVVTASTGCAAVGIQGSTLHSALKLGLGRDSATSLCSKIKSRRNIVARTELQRMDVLVIDEISMIDQKLFDLADLVVRAARCKYKHHQVKCTACPSFGKAQVILCGDFFQLPPVAERGQPEVRFCFESKYFKRLIKNVYRLRLVHRQDEWHFVGMLNELRRGVVTPSTQRVLAACRVPPGKRHEEVDESGQPVCFTKLFPFREQVRRENAACMLKLNTQTVIYKSSVVLTPHAKKGVVEAGLKNMRVEEEIQLRLGARVLCMKNVDVESGICNGSPGRIVAFYPFDMTDAEVMQTRNNLSKKDELVEKREADDNVPFRASGARSSAFAMRARARAKANAEKLETRAIKLDEEVIYLDGAAPESTPESKEAARARLRKEREAAKQQPKDSGGVAFHRSKEPSKRGRESNVLSDPAEQGLRLLKTTGLHPELKVPFLKMQPLVVPVVEFDNGVTRRIMPETWEICAANGNVEAKVTQIPLSLGYALSIHKSQGMTLARVQADLGGAFDCGQVYVALSRVSTLDGLRLPSFDPRKVAAHTAVRDFESELDLRN